MSVPAVEEIGIPTTHTAVREAIDWILGELGECDYGELGLTFVLHAGRITRIEQLKTKRLRADA